MLPFLLLSLSFALGGGPAAAAVTAPTRTSPGPAAAPAQQAEAPARQAASLQVRLSLDPEARALHGRMTIEGTDGPMELSFAEGYAYVTLEPRLTGELSATCAGERVEVEKVSPFVWRVEPKNRGPIQVAWSARLDHREHPDVVARNDAYEQPFTDGTSAMLFTGALVPVPRLADADVSVEIVPPVDAEGEPWAVLAPWPDSEGGLYAPTLEALGNDILMLGPWRTREVDADGLVATFVFAPGEERMEPLVESHLGPIVEHEVVLFGGAPQPRYLFVFGPSAGMPGYGGSPKTNAMTMAVSPDLPADFATGGISHLVAHEFHHTWMRARCRPVDRLRYVMEGFTDYFAYRTSWRLGHIDDDRYLGELQDQMAKAERALGGYGGSLASAGGPEFFLGRDAYQGCYAGGLTLALWTDLALRGAETPRELEEVMRDFYNDERWSADPVATEEHWQALLERSMGADRAAQHVEATRVAGGFDAVHLFASVEAKVERVEISAGDSPRANFEGTTLRQLDPVGPAALIGLRAGDRLVSVNGIEVESEEEVRRAWRAPLEGRLALELVREDKDLVITGPTPTLTTFRIAPELLERLR